ncbi:MAG: hypothetical protein IPL19_21630 [Sandaracinaceae bacterium]|nr:hypothetical protein [Sandaracinaceae bacterium]
MRIGESGGDGGAASLRLHLIAVSGVPCIVSTAHHSSQRAVSMTSWWYQRMSRSPHGSSTRPATVMG